MDRHREAHRAGGAHGQQHQAGQRRHRQQHQQRDIAAQQPARVDGIGSSTNFIANRPTVPISSSTPPTVPSSTGSADERVGRRPAQERVIDEPDRRRREAQHEAVEHRVMQIAAAHRERLGIVVASVTAAAEVLQRQHVPSAIARADRPIFLARAGIAPEVARAHPQRDQRRSRTLRCQRSASPRAE